MLLGPLETVQVGDVQLKLIRSDFPRAPLDPAVAAAVWDNPPYWGFCWPGGGWLSQWLPKRKPGGVVIDLGCGSGVLSIALAQAGCKVWAVDSDPEARRATLNNAQLNGVEFPVVASLRDLDCSQIQLLVLADFLYDPANLAQIEQLQEITPNLLLADCRLSHCPPGFEPLGQWTWKIVPDLDWSDEFQRVFVAATPGAMPYLL